MTFIIDCIKLENQNLPIHINDWLYILNKEFKNLKVINNHNKSYVYSFIKDNKEYILKILENDYDTYIELEICFKLISNKMINLCNVINVSNIRLINYCNQEYTYDYIIMEKYFTTLDLFSIDKLTLKNKKRFAMEIYNGIKQLHYLGYSHGDLKPSNICIDITSNKNNIKLIDFGLSEKITQKLNYSTLATYGWFNPIQIINCQIFKQTVRNDIKELLLLKYGKTINIIDENIIKNDKFAFCLILIYLFGNGYNFYFKNTKNNDASPDVLRNIKEFITAPVIYIFDILNNLKDMPIYWKQFIIKHMMKIFIS
jgi:serine/threonine protein kinase